MPANRAARRTLESGYVVIHRRFARIARQLGLQSAEAVLGMPGQVVSGHRDRHVMEVSLQGRRAFLKKEHRVSWLTRLRNWRAGFGRVSLAEREARTLDDLERQGAPVPRWLAYGADAAGRSFVLLQGARGRDLRDVLANGFLDECGRWELARNIGRAVAEVHRAGYTAPDLAAKHVLVSSHDRSVVLLDWPRAERRQVFESDHCLQTLAALHISLAPELATPRERMMVVRAYLRGLGFHCPSAPVARAALNLSCSMTRRRSLRDQTLPRTSQGPRIHWVEGERICVTHRLWTAWMGNTPAWLRRAASNIVNERLLDSETIPFVGESLLIRFPPARGFRNWFCRLFGRRQVSPGIVQAGLIFRLRRHGVPVAPVLAFGGRPDGGGFLMIQVTHPTTSLREWLAERRPGRNGMIRRVGRVMRRCHEAGCRGVRAELLQTSGGAMPRLHLIADGGLVRCRRLTRKQLQRDLALLARGLGLTQATDVQKLERGYRSKDRCPAGAKQLTSRSHPVVAEAA